MKIWTWQDLVWALKECQICGRARGDDQPSLEDPDLFDLHKGGMDYGSYFAVCNDCNEIMFNSPLRHDPDSLREIADWIESLGYLLSSPETLRKVGWYLETFRRDEDFRADAHKLFYKMAGYLEEEDAHNQKEG